MPSGGNLRPPVRISWPWIQRITPPWIDAPGNQGRARGRWIAPAVGGCHQGARSGHRCAYPGHGNAPEGRQDAPRLACVQRCHKKATPPQKARQGPKIPQCCTPRPGAVNRAHIQREEKRNTKGQKGALAHHERPKGTAPGSRHTCAPLANARYVSLIARAFIYATAPGTTSRPHIQPPKAWPAFVNTTCLYAECPICSGA